MVFSISIEEAFSYIGAVYLASQDDWRSLPPLFHLEGRGGDTVCSGGVEDGSLCSLFIASLSLSCSDPLPSYSPTSIKGTALCGAVMDLLHKGAVVLAPPFPGFCSRLFVV